MEGREPADLAGSPLRVQWKRQQEGAFTCLQLATLVALLVALAPHTSCCASGDKEDNTHVSRSADCRQGRRFLRPLQS